MVPPELLVMVPKLVIVPKELMVPEFVIVPPELLVRSEEHTCELESLAYLVFQLLLVLLMIPELVIVQVLLLSFFFFNDTATTEIYTLSLHDALPILMVPPELLLIFPPL